ncbi:MAG: DUF6491 family protein [Pseudobdellovibrio sp.]
MKELLLISAFVLSSVAMADECFYSRSIDGWSYDSQKEVITVEAFPGKYEVSARFCNQLSWANSIGFSSFGSYVCAGDRITVLDAWNNVIETCPIDSIKKVK